MKTIPDAFDFFKRWNDTVKWLADLEKPLIIAKNRQNKIKKQLPVMEDERSIVL